MARITHTDLPAFVKTVVVEIVARSNAAGLKKTEQAFVLALSGNLGAGKTTFMQALARELGVFGIVQSPTYVLMKSYPITPLRQLADGGSVFTTLIHIDAYRLDSPEEFQTLKPEEFLHNPQNLVCVEWPERIEEVLPAPNLTLNFSSDPPAGETRNTSDDSRYIEVV